MTDEAVTTELEDARIKFFEDRLLEMSRIRAAAEPYDGEADREDLAGYAGEVVTLRRTLRAVCAELNRLQPDPACDHCGMDPAAIREAALKEAEKALRDWQDSLNVHRMTETAIAVGMAADVVHDLIQKEPTDD